MKKRKTALRAETFKYVAYQFLRFIFHVCEMCFFSKYSDVNNMLISYPCLNKGNVVPVFN
jgi:hypothetical protein